MPSVRHLYFAAASVVALLVAIVAGIAGIRLCSPPALPGDDWWAWRNALEQAVAYAFGGASPGCYLPGWGSCLLALCRFGLWFAALGPIIWLIWELVWRPLRRARLRRSGRHALIFGDLDDVESLARDQRKRREIAFVAPDAQQGWRLANRFPFTEILSAGDTASLLKQVDALGGSAAAMVAAVSDRDLENTAVAEHLLLGSSDHAPNMALRVEQTVVRTMRSQPLHEAAEGKGSKLTVFSLSMLQLRAGIHEAMPGRFIIEGSKGYHAVICGSGPMVSQLAFMLARQGYWADQSLPRISVMRTGFRDFAPGQLERLMRSTLAATIESDHIDPEDVASFERAASAIATAKPFLHAIHCLGETTAEALALSQRWERVMLALRLPVPPIVAYGPKSVKSASGMIRTLPQFDPRDAAQAMRLADSRARAVHEDYIAGQRAEKIGKKEKFGEAPAEVEWERLAETFRDDNRNTADNIEYKLARVGLRAVASPEIEPFDLTETDVQQLGRIEHGRWMAAKNVAGFRHGAKRDDKQLLHPDLVPFDELSLPAQAKDYDVVRAIPKMLALGQQQVERARPSAVDPRGIPEVIIASAGAVAIAEAQLAESGELAIALWDEGRDMLAAGGALSLRLAALLRQSYEIRHVMADHHSEGIASKEIAHA